MSTCCFQKSTIPNGRYLSFGLRCFPESNSGGQFDSFHTRKETHSWIWGELCSFTVGKRFCVLWRMQRKLKFRNQMKHRKAYPSLLAVRGQPSIFPPFEMWNRVWRKAVKANWGVHSCRMTTILKRDAHTPVFAFNLVPNCQKLWLNFSRCVLLPFQYFLLYPLGRASPDAFF